MRTKKIKTTIVKKISYDDYGIIIEPTLLMMLLEYANGDTATNGHLYEVVKNSQELSKDYNVLTPEHYDHLVMPNNPGYYEETVVTEEVPVEVVPEVIEEPEVVEEPEFIEEPVNTSPQTPLIRI